MRKISGYIKQHPLSLLLLALPLALLAEWTHWGSIWVFFLSAIGVIPMAGYMGW